jgi:hypothetical protein
MPIGAWRACWGGACALCVEVSASGIAGAGPTVVFWRALGCDP